MKTRMWRDTETNGLMQYRDDSEHKIWLFVPERGWGVLGNAPQDAALAEKLAERIASECKLAEIAPEIAQVYQGFIGWGTA